MSKRALAYFWAVVISLGTLAVALSAHAGTVTRGTKASGGTAFVSGYTISPSEVNTDIDTLYTLVNGNVDDDNVKAAANVDPSKIGDYAATDAEFRTSTDPGVYGSEVKATTLEEEIAKIRYALHRLVNGNQTGTYWGDVPVIRVGRNVLANGGFDSEDVGSTTVPLGWTDLDDPNTGFVYEATDAAQGAGVELVMTCNSGATSGISQTLAGLHASTTYAFIGGIRPNAAGDSGTVVTTGAGTDLALAWTGATATTYSWHYGVFVVDASATSVVLTISCDAVADDVSLDNLAVIPISATPWAPPGAVIERDEVTGADAATFDGQTLVTYDDSTLLVTVTPPAAGYYIDVTAMISVEGQTTGTDCPLRLKENGTAVDWTIVDAPVNGDYARASLGYVNTNPTPGTAYAYTVDGGSSTGDTCKLNGATILEITPSSHLTVRLLPR